MSLGALRPRLGPRPGSRAVADPRRSRRRHGPDPKWQRRTGSRWRASDADAISRRKRGGIAGFVDALRIDAGSWPGPTPALDWPSYAAGRTRGLPWFLLAAKLVAQEGHSVLLHGWNSHQARHADVRSALPGLGISSAPLPQDAACALQRNGIAYLPLEAASRAALDLVRLRDVLGLRSPVNTALRLLNPGGASCSVQGVFHPPYRGLQTDASALLGQPRQMVLKGAGGEFERTPVKEITLMGLAQGRSFEIAAPPRVSDRIRLAEGRGGKTYPPLQICGRTVGRTLCRGDCHGHRSGGVSGPRRRSNRWRKGPPWRTPPGPIGPWTKPPKETPK